MPSSSLPERLTSKGEAIMRSIMGPSFGTLVRNVRKRAGWTQGECCLLLELSDINSLSDIERDERLPEGPLRMKVMKRLGFTREEQGWAHLICGEMPTEEEITRWTQALSEHIQIEVPALITDFVWNILDANKPARDFFHLQPAELAERPNMLELVVDPKSGFCRYLRGVGCWEQFLRERIFQFKLEQFIHLGRGTGDTCLHDLICRLFRHDEFVDAWLKLDEVAVRVMHRSRPLLGWNPMNLPAGSYQVLIDTVIDDQRFRREIIVPWGQRRD
ncbi:MAG: hypothetical protein A2172_04140 [Candidatus Woykebacteria bacterium RBG_13_40_15]|uniref:MmyB-like transcription regulator ligand binding domain-containing protein n=1 Tax=Candidatus Woykebacteria bacterium RBG_13_40_15 TaxID=1802593 RepID=A0A1G1W742_9BACT|nr:MAG: hypothetical protein A2172_04140 [Candidatus Woykebacteria bacterium RBG_13_40_15]